MQGHIPKTSVLVALWSAISAAAMLMTSLPVGILAGLGQWVILRSRLPLTHASAIPFALSFPAGQFPSFLTYTVAYINGFGGVEGPPEWFVPVALASGGLFAGLSQFLGLPKSWRNFVLWIPATSLAWGVSALGDLPIRGAVVLSAVCSGLVTGLVMLALSPRRSHDSEGRSALEGLAGAHVGSAPRKTVVPRASRTDEGKSRDGRAGTTRREG